MTTTAVGWLCMKRKNEPRSTSCKNSPSPVIDAPWSCKTSFAGSTRIIMFSFSLFPVWPLRTASLVHCNALLRRAAAIPSCSDPNVRRNSRRWSAGLASSRCSWWTWTKIRADRQLQRETIRGHRPTAAPLHECQNDRSTRSSTAHHTFLEGRRKAAGIPSLKRMVRTPSWKSAQDCRQREPGQTSSTEVSSGR